MNLGVGTIRPYTGPESLVFSEPGAAGSEGKHKGGWGVGTGPMIREEGRLPAVVAVRTQVVKGFPDRVLQKGGSVLRTKSRDSVGSLSSVG